MHLRFERTKSRSELDTIADLYLTSFPPSERREYEGLIRQLQKDECSLYIIRDSDITAGFFTIWDFGFFAFLEHLAISPAFQGKGTGASTLAWIEERWNKPLVLETECPVDTYSERRIEFYIRNGFSILDDKYFQPAYDKDKPEVKMLLMCNRELAWNKLPDQWKAEIRSNVYF